MTKYIIIHNKHEGCYDFKCYEDENSKMRLTSITINPPKIFQSSNNKASVTARQPTFTGKHKSLQTGVSF